MRLIIYFSVFLLMLIHAIVFGQNSESVILKNGSKLNVIKAEILEGDSVKLILTDNSFIKMPLNQIKAINFSKAKINKSITDTVWKKPEFFLGFRMCMNGYLANESNFQFELVSGYHFKKIGELKLRLGYSKLNYDFNSILYNRYSIKFPGFANPSNYYPRNEASIALGNHISDGNLSKNLLFVGTKVSYLLNSNNFQKFINFGFNYYPIKETITMTAKGNQKYLDTWVVMPDTLTMWGGKIFTLESIPLEVNYSKTIERMPFFTFDFSFSTKVKIGKKIFFTNEFGILISNVDVAINETENYKFDYSGYPIYNEENIFKKNYSSTSSFSFPSYYIVVGIDF